MILRRDAVVRVLGGDPVTLVTPSPKAAGHLDDALGNGGLLDTDTPAGAALARALTDRGMAHPHVTGSAGPPRDLDAVAVVVPVRDDAAGVAALTNSLGPELARGLHLVVVDDGSATPLIAPARTPGPALVVLRHERARGPAAARNAGTAAALEAGAEVVVYLDADVLPRTGWLDPLLAHLDDPLVAAVAPRIVAAEPGRFWVRGYETARSALDMGVEPARVRPRTRVPYVPSAALAVRPDRLPAPPAGGGRGPFDERLQVAEDVDLRAGAVRTRRPGRPPSPHHAGAAARPPRVLWAGRGTARGAARPGGGPGGRVDVVARGGARDVERDTDGSGDRGDRGGAGLVAHSRTHR